MLCQLCLIFAFHLEAICHYIVSDLAGYFCRCLHSPHLHLHISAPSSVYDYLLNLSFFATADNYCSGLCEVLVWHLVFLRALSLARCFEGGRTINCLHSSIISHHSGCKGDMMIFKCLDAHSIAIYGYLGNLLSSKSSPDGQILLRVALYDHYFYY